MRRIIVTLIIVLGSMGSAKGNPITPADYVYVSAFPPEIGIVFRDSINLEGDTIYTTSGSAVIFSYDVPGSEDTVIFDSSNTSGFIINPEADSICISSLYYLNTVRLGTFWWAPTPIKGHPIHLVWVNPFRNEGGWWDWSYDFTFTDWSWTDVVINEISSNCNWRPESNFIELYNQSDSTIDIGSWKIICDTICEIQLDAVIEGNGFYVIDQTDFPPSFDMDFDSDNIYLVRGDTIVDQVGWSSDPGANVSFMRFPDGDVDTTNYLQGYMGYNDASSYTFENGFPSRGAPNRHTSPGFVVIGAHGLNESGSVNLRWTDPIWEPVFAYSLAVRNFHHYPQDITDGDVVYQGTEQQAMDMVPPGHAAAYYTVFARNAGGGYSIPTDESRVFVLLETVGIDQEPELPERISSLRCYPNPFNATVIIEFVLSQSEMVTLSVYNLRGQRVAVLADGSMSAGEHRITWDASEHPSGIFFCMLMAEKYCVKGKMILIK
jgi:hypothetical protein